MRVDYSELVVAIQGGDDPTANRLLKEVMPRLVEYLRVVMKADRNVAKECAQQAMADVLERIQKKKIKEDKYIFSYLMTASRNEFLKYSKFQHRFDTDPDEDYEQAEPAQQVQALIEEERMKILKSCLNELDEENREFIDYILNNPDKSTKEYAAHFKFSSANVRTKKSRLVNALHYCFKRKSSE
ncbi:MAG: sigma-70 family RNA polymerase sigma factor [Balneolaceae bacterium]|nr:sigma-70 family RNA polymerase sigma factor [Balneolaceae bacterium]MCH8549980.1 sigma-70 family RNA polymerase sigma factor [Balneolaceae bacterium]